MEFKCVLAYLYKKYKFGLSRYSSNAAYITVADVSKNNY